MSHFQFEVKVYPRQLLHNFTQVSVLGIGLSDSVGQNAVIVRREWRFLKVGSLEGHWKREDPRDKSPSKTRLVWLNMSLLRGEWEM